MARISEAEMERIMAQYGASVKRMCRLQLGDGHLAEDAAQETFIKVWRSGGGFRGECTEKTWILRIAINACRDIRRGAWFRRVDRTRPVEELPLPTKGNGPDLAGEIAALPPRYREIIVLYYYQGMPLGDAALAMGININTAKSRLQRARKMLRTELEGGEAE